MRQGTSNRGSAAMDVRKFAQSVSMKPSWLKRRQERKMEAQERREIEQLSGHIWLLVAHISKFGKRSIKCTKA